VERISFAKGGWASSLGLALAIPVCAWVKTMARHIIKNKVKTIYIDMGNISFRA
jgi:hypothetical protein